MKQYFDHVVFDVDSTLCAIEGVDELARWKGCLDQVSTLTDLAMNGQLDFQAALEERLALIQPHRRDLKKLGDHYYQTITPGTREVFQELRQYGTQIHLVSGGYTQALAHLADNLNIAATHTHCIDIHFDLNGNYRGFDRHNLLCQPAGKKMQIKHLQARYPGQSFAMIGDGMSDAETSDVVDRFICFAGHVQRLPVMNLTPWIVFEPDLRSVLPLVVSVNEYVQNVHSVQVDQKGIM